MSQSSIGRTYVGFLVAGLLLVSACERENPIERTARALSTPVSVSFQDGTSGFDGTTDTQIRQNTPTTTYGSATSLNADGDEPANGGQDVAALLRWDVSSIPVGGTIQAASISLRVTNATTNTYPILPLSRAWVEAQATWNLAEAGSAWQSAGAMGATDRGSTSLGSLAAPVAGSYTVTLSAAGIAAVQQWVGNPATNFGIIIASASNTDGVDFASSENATITYRPRLSVTYLPPEQLDAAADAASETGGGGTGGGGSGGSGTGGSGTGGSGTGGSGTGGSGTGGSGTGGSGTGGSGTGGSMGSGGDGTGGSGTGGATTPPVFLYAVGDIADRLTTTDTATGLLLDASTDPILALGDIAYPNGSSSDFSRYFVPPWGRHKPRIKPIPGNHEYQTANATGYFGYFGAAAGNPATGYYSYNHGAWHIVALNTGRCSTSPSTCITQAQLDWLDSDLAANPRACTLAYWHHPRFSSGEHGSNPSVASLWTILANRGADVVLTGHDHDYERFVAQDAAGQPSADGIVELVVGTGGTALRQFTSPPLATTAVRDSTSHGVLKLTLRDTSYDWQFIPIAGKTFTDTGSASCH